MQFKITIPALEALEWTTSDRVVRAITAQVAGVLIELTGVPNEDDSPPAAWDVFVGPDPDGPFRYRVYTSDEHLPLEEAKARGYELALGMLRTILSDIAVEEAS